MTSQTLAHEQYTANLASNSEGSKCSGSRRPCDPDFGLGRTLSGKRSYNTHTPLFRESTCVASLPVTPSCADSDELPSLYDLNAFDFPVPPPMCSTAIRRIRSSPWFNTLDESRRDKSCVQRWRDGVDVFEPTKFKRQPSRIQRNSVGAYPEETEFESARQWRIYADELRLPGGYYLDASLLHEDQSLLPEALLSLDNLGTERLDVSSISSSYPGRLSWGIPNRHSGDMSTNHISELEEQVSTAASRTMKTMEHQEQHPFVLGPLPRIIRKVASMRSDNPYKMEAPIHESLHLAGQRQIPKRRSFRTVFIPTSERLDDANKEKGKCVYCSPNRSVLTSQLEWAGHTVLQESRGRFSLRSSQSTTATPAGGKGRPLTSKSFIDITPDKEMKSTERFKKERFRDLMARAGNSLFGWKKGKANRSPTK